MRIFVFSLLFLTLAAGAAVYAQSIGSNNGISNVVGGGGSGGGSHGALVLFIP